MELRVEAAPGMTVTYVLRWPTGDFLARRAEANGSMNELEVVEELCDERLRLCVPKASRESLDGKAQVSIRLTTVELDVDVPADDFSPRPPEGWATQTRQVVESE